MLDNLEPTLSKPAKRRDFLRWSGGMLVGTAVVLQACKDDTVDTPKPADVNLGSGDIGILNYAYALEQLEAAFYIEVTRDQARFERVFADGGQQRLIRAIRDHEIAHREFFKAAIPAANRIIDLTPEFKDVRFDDRNSILTTARTFEDVGVAAYNGAAKLISAAGGIYLTLAAQIVSVEARHAAYIRDIISNGSFSDLASLVSLGADNANGLDAAQNPPQILAAVQPFIKNKINGNNLPTS